MFPIQSFITEIVNFTKMFLSDDDMVECPYNKTHRMLRRRLQTHLHKCRLQYPDVELRKCPFNTTHLIPEPEFAVFIQYEINLFFK